MPANQIVLNQRSSDYAIWSFAKNNSYHILTFDEDFTAIQNLYGSPPKVIWLRTGNLTTADIASTLINLEEQIKNFLLDPESGVFEITSYS
ncbi:DUF5615 family PIN-like protein [uncultured Mucilaginibacter sp.]|uniref:DUF5615 family PIN-like protein n=1 Tax=uncultured Mucilaginibacter sp. TaxID=797541 RepID=UPI0026234F0D|nr:DUF5615 family PIN-like protein [uncultured Mucilaginibacter sp.]